MATAIMDRKRVVTGVRTFAHKQKNLYTCTLRCLGPETGNWEIDSECLTGVFYWVRDRDPDGKLLV